jgi:2-hydroxy-3-oxopropionate reductase
MKLGFIGLGIMGKPMAGHLLAAGHTVHLHSRSGVPDELVAKGGLPCASSADVTRQADIVFTMLPDTPDVEAVLFGATGIASALRTAQVIVDMSSISPVATRGFAKRIESMGGEYLDAPVSGGDVGARNATLSIMVGGKEEVFQRVMPLFELLGKNITRIGGNGDGQTCKVANQIVVAATIGAVAEGLLFAAKAGADPAIVRQALMGGLATSRILEVHGARMLERRFEPGFRVALHQKDLNLALSAASSLQLSLPHTNVAQELFTACTNNAGAGWDHSGMIRALEALAGFEIGTRS